MTPVEYEIWVAFGLGVFWGSVGTALVAIFSRVGGRREQDDEGDD